MSFFILLKRHLRAGVLALLLVSGFTTAQAQCNVEFFREDFDPPSTTCSNVNSPSCYARTAFTSDLYSLASGTNPSNFSAGQFKMMQNYTSVVGSGISPSSKEFCAAGQVTVNQGVSLWSKPLNVPAGKATVTLEFSILNNSNTSYLNITCGFTGQSGQVTSAVFSLARYSRQTITITKDVSQLAANPYAYISMRDQSNSTPQTASVAIDDIVLKATEAGPADFTRTVCGFGMRNVVGPGSGNYKWYLADGVTVLSPTASNSITTNITTMRTTLRVAEVNPTTQCESRQCTATINVEGIRTFLDDFNSTADYQGYPQGWLANFVVDTTKMNFSTGYGPVIVRYIDDHYQNQANCYRQQNNGYPCYPGNIAPGDLTVSYDPYSYNSGWLMWPNTVTTPLNPASPNPPANRFLIADAKFIANSAGRTHKLWSRKVAVRAGYNYEVRLKMMNANLVNGNPPLPTTPRIVLGNGPSAMPAQLTNRATGYTPISGDVGIAQQASWTEVTYLVSAPTTIPADGLLRLSLFTVNADNNNGSGGQDFLLDDIELYEMGSATGPLVNNATQCDPGSVALTATAPGDYYWFSDPDLTQQIGTGNSINVTTTTRGLSYFYVQDRIMAGCPSVVKRVQVKVYNTAATFAVTPQPGGAIPIAAGYEVTFAATPGTAGSTPSYTWNWSDGSANETVNSANITHTFAKPGSYPVKLTVTEHFRESDFPNQDCSRESAITTIPVFDPLCALVVPIGGQFSKDNRTGADTYKFDSPLDCIPASAFECIGEAGNTFSGVVSTSATAFADTLVRADLDYSAAAANPLLDGRGRMRPYGSYTYRAPLASGQLSYAAGTFTMNAFNWQSSARARHAVWIPSARATRVSPDGQVLQEQDALNVKSTAKFGYGRSVSTGTATALSAHAMPYLKAQNADYSSVLFESFETVCELCTGTRYGEDALALLTSEVAIENAATTGKAHTGSKAVRLVLSGNQGQLTLKSLPVTAQLRQVGLNVKVWVQTEGLTLDAATTKVWVSTSTSPATAIGNASLRALAQTGEWTLYEAMLPLNTAGISVGITLIPHLQLGGTATSGTAVIRLDDVRMQPQDAQMTSYVYDPASLRVLAVFDDQHFPLLYQYNTEGMLIRKQVETERGVKTLKETFYHTPQVNR